MAVVQMSEKQVSQLCTIPRVSARHEITSLPPLSLAGSMPHTKCGFVQFRNAGLSSKAQSRLGRGSTYLFSYEKLTTFLLAFPDSDPEHTSQSQTCMPVATEQLRWHGVLMKLVGSASGLGW